MPFIAKKDGIQYIYGPINTLDALPAGAGRGKKLQAFFDANNIKIDLTTGTGEAISELYFVPILKDGSTNGFHQIFADTNYRHDHLAKYNNQNMDANLHLRTAIRNGICASNLYIWRPREEAPRKIYLNENGEFSMSEPLDANFNPEKLKPKKPNFLKRMLHAINDDWFRDDFDKYSRERQEYDKFARDFEKTKADAAARKIEVDEKAKQYSKDNEALNAYEHYKDVVASFDYRIDKLLGKNPTDCEESIAKSVYKKGEYNPVKLDYPAGLPFGDHDIAVINYAALSDGKVSSVVHGSKYLTEEETADRNYVHAHHDILYSHYDRANSGSVYLPIYDAAREKANECLKKYAEGDKQPLAELLGHSLRFHLNKANGFQSYGELAAANNRGNDEIMSILEKDPELMEKSGLTEEDVAEYRGRREMAEFYGKYSASRSELQKAGRGEITLSEEAKKEHLLNVMTGNALFLMDRNEFDEYGRQHAEEIAQSAAQMAEAVQNYGRLDGQYSSMPDGPEKEALKPQLQDAFEKKDAALVKQSMLECGRPASSVVRMFMNDDDKHTLLNEFKAKVAASDKFAEYSGMTIEQIRESQYSGPNAKIIKDSAEMLVAISRESVQNDRKNQEPQEKAPEIIAEEKKVSVNVVNGEGNVKAPEVKIP